MDTYTSLENAHVFSIRIAPIYTLARPEATTFKIMSNTHKCYKCMDFM